MKVVFLDFDGVLNGDDYVRRQGRFGLILDPEKLALLKKLIYATDAKIVLSTSWREHWSSMEEQCDSIGLEMNRIFRSYQMEIYDKTPQLRFQREQAIYQWLQQYPQVENFVVLDDRFLSADFLKEHFVLTSNLRGGLDEDDIKKAIDILERSAH